MSETGGSVRPAIARRCLVEDGVACSGSSDVEVFRAAPLMGDVAHGERAVELDASRREPARIGEVTRLHRFDVERRFDRHVTFGYGIHFCLGANLARLEGRVVLEETLARFPEWGVDEAQVDMVRTSTVRGPVHVPITI